MKRHQRRSIRLQGYDYAQEGAYFVTIGADQHQCLFGAIQDDEMVLNEWGKIIQMCWDAIPEHEPMVELDAFVVMPNHVHGIIVIDHGTPGMMYHAPTENKRQFAKPIAHSLSTIVGTFKAAVTRSIRRMSGYTDAVIWQRNYYEHIIRDAASLQRLREYILYNPMKWTMDQFYESR